MAKYIDLRKFREDKKQHPWRRGGDSLVAVNPERITTLFELAKEHYGMRCAKCGRKRTNQLVVHHRHYRTIGFEKPVEDIVLLCKECHDDLHDRSKHKMLSKDDAPFLDPEWKNLPSEAEVQNRAQSEKNYKARIAELATFPEWVGYFKSKTGEDLYDFGLYRDEEEAERNFKSEAAFLGLVYVSFEQKGIKSETALKGNGNYKPVPTPNW